MTTSRILIASDSEICIEMVKGYLKQSPTQIFVARTYDQIVSLSRKTSPELLILDQPLSGKEGVPFCSEIRKASHIEDLPIIVLSSSNKENCGFIDNSKDNFQIVYLSKPLNRKNFLEAGRAILDKIERREPRILCRAMASCRQDGINFFGTIEDVSPQGLFIGTNFHAELGSLISLRFMLPLQESLLIETEAKVAWRITERSNKHPQLPIGLGIEFMRLTEEDESQLRDFIARSTLRIR